MATAVWWIRRDLRLADNPALLAALAAADAVVPLFVLDDRLWGPAGEPRRAFLAGCLRELSERTDGHLVVRTGQPEDVVAAVVREVDAGAVFAAEDFGPYGRARDARVASHVDLRLVGSPYAVAPGEILTGDGRPYRVFTPYYRAWRSHGWSPPVKAPANARWDRIASEPIPTVEQAIGWASGEEAAKAMARRFWDEHLATYGEGRDRPGADATSRLSPYLKWGCIHPRQLLAMLGPDDDAFARPLCWRDFYADVLFADPGSARRAWSPALANIATDSGPGADAAFEAWVAGQTGYPLVDAGMRQLTNEGWMHNRVRMSAASFLVKDLHLDWRRGAAYFMRALVDGDLASNQHGWQWVAGTGTDASPYHRVFNPILQSKRFDPDGEYIRRYVPELRDLPAPVIHEPWKAPDGPPAGYPSPIVDHATERLEALRRYDHARRHS
jgi:deoxyribodipyrimidine photo-lyase